MREVGLLDCKVLGRWGPCRLVIRGSGMSMVILRTWQTWDRILVLSGARGWLIWGGQWIGIHGKEGVKTKKKWLSSDRGNRTPGCRVRDGDVSHYTISDVVEELHLILQHKPRIVKITPTTAFSIYRAVSFPTVILQRERERDHNPLFSWTLPTKITIYSRCYRFCIQKETFLYPISLKSFSKHDQRVN